MSNKKQTILMVVLVAVLILIAAGITYAYFTGGAVDGEKESTVVVTGGYLQIRYDNLSNQIEIENIYPRNDAWVIKNFTVTGRNTTDLLMKYKVGIEVQSNTFTAGVLTYTLENTRNDSGTAIPNITSTVLPQSGSVWFGTGSFLNGESKVHGYTLKIYFPNANVNQNSNQDKKLTARILIEEDGTKNPTDTELFANKIGTSGDGSLYEDAYGNLRYDGIDPDNYAYFNCDDNENPTEATCEKWRIIGVFDVKPSESGTTEKRIKLIKNDSIGTSAFGSYNNTWSSSYIRTGFSRAEIGTAYGTVSGSYQSPSSFTFILNNAAQSQIDNAVWYIGASGHEVTATQVYTNEQSATWTGKMGLMSLSDYGFASSSCKDGSQTLYYYNDSSCTGSNWLKKGIREWTITPYSGYSYCELHVGSSGFVYYYNSLNQNGVRPVVYLKSNIKVTGEGTSGSPYTFS